MLFDDGTGRLHWVSINYYCPACFRCFANDQQICLQQHSGVESNFWVWQPFAAPRMSPSGGQWGRVPCGAELPPPRKNRLFTAYFYPYALAGFSLLRRQQRQQWRRTTDPKRIGHECGADLAAPAALAPRPLQQKESLVGWILDCSWCTVMIMVLHYFASDRLVLSSSQLNFIRHVL